MRSALKRMVAGVGPILMRPSEPLIIQKLGLGAEKSQAVQSINMYVLDVIRIAPDSKC